MDFSEQKRGLVFAMSNVLRTSRLIDMINTQEAAANFAMLLDRQKPGQPIDLTPWYEYLTVHKQCPTEAVDEAVLFFKSREGRFNVTFVLPKALAALDETTKNRIVSEFITRGATSGTFVGLGGDSSRRAADEPKSTKPATLMSPPTRSGAAKKPLPTMKILLGALAAVIVGGVGVTVWVGQGAPPEAATLTITDAGALPCAEVRANAGWAVCRMRVADFERHPRVELNKMAAVTKAAAGKMGYERGLHVVTIEDGKLRATF